MSSSQNTFSKSERLCRIRILAHLFEKGDVFHTALFKVFWAVSPETLPAPAQVAFSVSKKAFKKAVSRNLAKRRMREAYRLNKSRLYEHLLFSGKQIVMVVVLKGTVIPEYSEVEKGIISVLDRLMSLNPR